MNAAPQLQRLAARTGTAVGLAPDDMARELKAALGDATAADWLPAEKRRANHDNYARHLLYGDPQGRFSILAIVWDHGQMSPIHAHHCWCAVGVYRGTLAETLYRENAVGSRPVPVSTTNRVAGSLSFDGAASSIHRLANESGAVAISLHVYGIAKDSISIGVNRLFPTS